MEKHLKLKKQTNLLKKCFPSTSKQAISLHLFDRLFLIQKKKKKLTKKQLNMYDFHKLRSENDENEWKHKLFRKGFP